MTRNRFMCFMFIIAGTFPSVNMASASHNKSSWESLNATEQRFVWGMGKLGLDLITAVTMSDDQIQALRLTAISSSTQASTITPEDFELAKKELITARATRFMRAKLGLVHSNVERATQLAEESGTVLTRAELVARARAIRENSRKKK